MPKAAVRCRNKYRLRFVPEESALLIIDMQSYFLDKRSHAFLPQALVIIPRIKKLSLAFTASGLPVIYTRHLNTEKDAGMLKPWWDDLILENNPLSRITPHLLINHATVIKKTQYDAFYRTPLADLLKRKKITQVVITGVMTHLCCETTARSAFVRGFQVFFVADGTATQNEKFRRATLLNLAHGFAVPVFTSEILRLVQE